MTVTDPRQRHLELLARLGAGPALSDDDAVARLLGTLELDRVDQVRFHAPLPTGDGRVFGGQLVAQALQAASLTVAATRPVNSLHAYFVRAGRPGVPLVLDVWPWRDGGSFSTRHVTASQDGVPVLELMASFHAEEPGANWQLGPPAAVPSPEGLSPLGLSWIPLSAFDIRPVLGLPDPAGFPKLHPFWIRTRAPVGDDPVTHASLLVHLSDIALMGRAAGPGCRFDVGRSASLDHAVWFHRPARVDDWLLYDAEPTTNAGARGLARGTLHTADGALVATIVQEALLRPGPDDARAD